MKKDKGKEMVIVPAILALSVILAFVVYIVSKDRPTSYDLAEVVYSYHSSYGSMIDTADKIITISSNGQVKLTNSYNSLLEIHSIPVSKYKELQDYINERGAIFNKKLSENNSVMDGGYDSITIKIANGDEKTVGGYMISNSKYSQIIDKIVEIVGHDNINNYEDRIN